MICNTPSFAELPSPVQSMGEGGRPLGSPG
jgi:hypothetical protein